MVRYLAATIAVMLLVISGVGAFAAIYPTVSLQSYDPATFEYTYTVTAPANMSHSFNWLQVDTFMPGSGPSSPWVITGAFVNGVNMAWTNTSAVYDPFTGNASARWNAVTRAQVVAPGQAWSGLFTLIVPNSLPVPGVAATKGALVASWNVSQTLVPGPLPQAPSPSPLDETPPATVIILSGEQNNGWYTGDVTVELEATDDEGGSGVMRTEYSLLDGAWNDYSDPFVVDTEGILTVTAKSVDNENNEEQDPLPQSRLKIDKTPPIVTATQIPSHLPTYLVAKDVLEVTFTASDQLSGLDGPPNATVGFTPSNSSSLSSSSPVPVTPITGVMDAYKVQIQPQGPGLYTIGLGAVDRAGHRASFSTGMSFVVTGYDFEWLPPISIGNPHEMKAGSTLPVKFRLRDPNNNLYVWVANCKITITKDDEDADPVNDEIFLRDLMPNYVPGNRSYHANVSTKSWPVGCYTVRVTGNGIWDSCDGAYSPIYSLQLR